MPFDSPRSAVVAALPVAVLFDLDGTLVNTIPDLAGAIDAMRADFGLPPLGPELAARYVGHGVEPFVADSLAHGGGPTAAADQARALAAFRTHYRNCNGIASVPYPGVVAGLQRWRQLGRRLAVVTNKSTEFTLPLLDRMQLARYFDLVVCGDTCAHRKPDPEPLRYACGRLGVGTRDALFIGDSINDARAAAAAGVRALAVPYGYRAGADVHSLPVAAVVAGIAESVTWAETHWSAPTARRAGSADAPIRAAPDADVAR